MFRFIKKTLSRRLAVLCILLGVLICTATSICGYFQYRDTIYRTYNEFAYQLDEMARSYVDGDVLMACLETGTPDDAYNEMAASIYQLYVHSSLYHNKSGIYICIPDKETLTLTNLYDVRIHEAEEEYKQYYAIGVVDPMGIRHPEHAISVFETGERSDDYFIHETKHGYNSSAMLPVYNGAGEIVALIVTDIPIPSLNRTLAGYLLNNIVLTTLVIAVFMGFFVAITKKIVVNPLHLIAKEASSFTDKDIRISEDLQAINRTDEIGMLASDFVRMEKDIQTYVTNLTAVTAEKERIGAELDVAKNIQASMLPCIFPAFPDRRELDIYATMTPAKEVGGDFYDFFMVDNRHLAIVMADVSGKGVPAALFMVIGKTLIKDHTLLGNPLDSVFNKVNNLLCESNSEGLFITAFEGVLDLVTGEFTFVNAGHEMPYIYRKAEKTYAPYKIRPGFVLAGMEDMRYRVGTLNLELGDRIFQYTDGVTEATDIRNTLYGTERLCAVLNRSAEMTPEETLRTVKADIDAFVGEAPQFDDITMLCLEYKEKMKEE